MRVDQFAWGALAYEALTGRAAASMALPIIAFPSNRRDLVEVVPVPAWLGAIVDRALSPNPTARFPTMRDTSSMLGRRRELGREP